MKVCAALVALLLVFGLAACGGNDDEPDDAAPPAAEEPAEEPAAEGRQVFAMNCGGCHVLEDAGTTGTIGPPLDGHGLSHDQVEQQVRQGGGAMPAFEGTLSDEEIEAVSAYVAEQGG